MLSGSYLTEGIQADSIIDQELADFLNQLRFPQGNPHSHTTSAFLQMRKNVDVTVLGPH